MEELPLDFEIVPAVPEREDALQLSLESWEGPLDLLLALARSQKVDLKQISILALVEQYLTFIAEARELKLEVAADYLVMAAWLAYLKSALLLPKDPLEDPSPDELALRLQLRLQRLAAMRDAAARLLARDRIGRDVFLRAKPDMRDASGVARLRRSARAELAFATLVLLVTAVLVATPPPADAAPPAPPVASVTHLP